MKPFSFFLFLFIHLNTFSQNKITGSVIDKNGQPIPRTVILEEESGKRDTTDVEGRFQITTTQDTSRLTFSWVGFSSQSITITQDTTIIVTLEIWSYENHFITLGASYDALNSAFGFLISNGLDEQPIIHFESFTETWLYKLDGTTDFQNDYSLGGKFGRCRISRNIIRPIIEYRKIAYVSKEFQHTDVNLSFLAGWRGFPGVIKVKSGYQYLNGKNNIGVGIGWQSFYRNFGHYGFRIGYWDDYWTYHVFFQSYSDKKNIGIRASYDRIEKFDFLNLGIHFTFIR